MPAFNAVNTFRQHLAQGVHNFDSDTFKVALTNVAPDAADVLLSDITQIASGGGYTSGGYTLDNFAVVPSGANVKITVDEETVTATAGGIATFRYLVIYNSTPTSPVNPIVGWIDQGEARAFLEDEQFRIRFDAALGAISIA